MNQNKLIDSLNKDAQFIHNKCIYGSANYITCSPKNAESLNEVFDKYNFKEKNKLRLKKLERILNVKVDK